MLIKSQNCIKGRGKDLLCKKSPFVVAICHALRLGISHITWVKKLVLFGNFINLGSTRRESNCSTEPSFSTDIGMPGLPAAHGVWVYNPAQIPISLFLSFLRTNMKTTESHGRVWWGICILLGGQVDMSWSLLYRSCLRKPDSHWWLWDLWEL